MQKLQQPKLQPRQRSVHSKRLQFILDDQTRVAIPLGPGFQATIPDWTGPPSKKHPPDDDLNTSRWLGTQIWPIKGRKPETDTIGKGRPNSCICASPGSEECVKRHVSDARVQLRVDLVTAFFNWKFNEMGEEVSKLWKKEEQKKLESLVKINPRAQGKSFLKPALESLPRQCRESIVSYYFNVYVPRRISMKTRSGCEIIDTDDEDTGDVPPSKSSRKRCKADGNPSGNSKHVNTKYLAGPR